MFNDEWDHSSLLDKNSIFLWVKSLRWECMSDLGEFSFQVGLELGQKSVSKTFSCTPEIRTLTDAWGIGFPGSERPWAVKTVLSWGTWFVGWQSETLTLNLDRNLVIPAAQPSDGERLYSTIKRTKHLRAAYVWGHGKQLRCASCEWGEVLLGYPLREAIYRKVSMPSQPWKFCMCSRVACLANRMRGFCAYPFVKYQERYNNNILLSFCCWPLLDIKLATKNWGSPLSSSPRASMASPYRSNTKTGWHKVGTRSLMSDPQSFWTGNTQGRPLLEGWR